MIVIIIMIMVIGDHNDSDNNNDDDNDKNDSNSNDVDNDSNINDVNISFPEGIFQVWTNPPSDIPNFASSTHELEVTYSALCCEPMVTISVYDVAANLGVCNVDNGSLEAELLNKGEIAGIVVGAVVLLLLLILLAAGIVIRRRRTRTEDVTPRRRGARNSNDE